MKRLLCIVSNMNAGGAETFLMKLYRSLDRSKYQMDFIVAIEEKGFYDDEIVSLGGRIFHVLPKSKGFFKNFKEIVTIVRKNKYQSVLRVSQHSLSALDLFAAKLGGAKKLAFRSSNTNTTDASKKEILLHKICLFMPQVFANIKLAPSTEAAEFLFGKGCIQRGKAQILHNALDLNIYCYDETGREQIRKDFGITEDTMVVGHIGRFMKQKNHSFLINVFNEIYKKDQKSKLLLVGKGELESQIKAQVKKQGLQNNVIFCGVRSDIPQLLSAMDVFVFPSFYEGMPNTVIEAQATGLPCVISDTITKEADVTGNVKYMTLKDSYKKWADSAVEAAKQVRSNGADKMRDKGYDIKNVTEQFIKLVF